MHSHSPLWWWICIEECNVFHSKLLQINTVWQFTESNKIHNTLSKTASIGRDTTTMDTYRKRFAHTWAALNKEALLINTVFTYVCINVFMYVSINTTCTTNCCFATYLYYSHLNFTSKGDVSSAAAPEVAGSLEHISSMALTGWPQVRCWPLPYS